MYRCRARGGPLVDTSRVAIDEAERLDQLGRYEARLARAFDMAAQLLERRQARRRQDGQRQEGRHQEGRGRAEFAGR